MSGLDQEETVLVLFPDCIKDGFHELAFVRRTSEHTSIWEGDGLSKEQARKISGIEKIFWLDEMDMILHELILLAKRIYVNLNEHDRFSSEIPNRNLRFTRQLQSRYPAGHVGLPFLETNHHRLIAEIERQSDRSRLAS